jgi:recombinational DNA repair protein RecT
MAKNAPKEERKASVSYVKAYNKNVKSILKSPEVKNNVDAVTAKNKSGGSKPFSKNTILPSGPSVPKKGKK